MPPEPSASPARRRLVDIAAQLFYDHGVAASGVDTIVARAGVSKPTLYHHFASKDELLAEVLAERHQEYVAALPRQLQEHAPTPREQLLAVFDWYGNRLESRGGSARGCAFVNAAVELPDGDHPAWQVIRDHKRWVRNLFRDLATAAGITDAGGLADALALLLEGVTATSLVQGTAASAARARDAAALLVTAYEQRAEA